MAVLSIARKCLREGNETLRIGRRVVARQRIVEKLRGEFPDRKILVGGQVDIKI